MRGFTPIKGDWCQTTNLRDVLAWTSVHHERAMNAGNLACISWRIKEGAWGTASGIGGVESGLMFSRDGNGDKVINGFDGDSEVPIRGVENALPRAGLYRKSKSNNR